MITNASRIFILGLVAFVLFGAFTVVKANPSFFIRAQSASSVTSYNYLTPLAGTTTIPSTGSFDLGVGGAQGADSAVLLLQFLGSTTPITQTMSTTTYNVALEYSQDNVSWYQNGYILTSTTTNPINGSNPIYTTYTMASTTLNGVLLASTTPQGKLINVATPLRYVRAVVTIPAGSSNGAVWGEFVAKRQAN